MLKDDVRNIVKALYFKGKLIFVWVCLKNFPASNPEMLSAADGCMHLFVLYVSVLFMVCEIKCELH